MLAVRATNVRIDPGEGDSDETAKPTQHFIPLGVPKWNSAAARAKFKAFPQSFGGNVTEAEHNLSASLFLQEV